MARQGRGDGTGDGRGDRREDGDAGREGGRMRAPAPELARPVPVDRIGDGPHPVAVAATDEERGRIALRLGIVAVGALEARYALTALPDGVVDAEGELSARVVQDCVVSLEPFEADIAERFRVRFVPASGFDPTVIGEPDAIDEIPYEGRAIDLGEATVEQLALALDPFPRAPGAALGAEAGEEPDDRADGTAGRPDEGAASPFAALARKWPKRP